MGRALSFYILAGKFDFDYLSDTFLFDEKEDFLPALVTASISKFVEHVDKPMEYLVFAAYCLWARISGQKMKFDVWVK